MIIRSRIVFWNKITFIKYRNAVAIKLGRNKILKVCLHSTSFDCKIKTPSNSHYFIENGLRYVYPYHFEFSNFCKGRWIGKKLINIFCEEFPLYPAEEYHRRIRVGLVKVNGKVQNPNYILKSADHISSVIHRHELAVLSVPIRILFEDDEMLVVNKPPSIPVHPCGLFNRNTIINILGQEKRFRDLFLIHRLDRLTSGVFIMAKTKDKSATLSNQIRLHNVRKEYVCRVEGNFPDKPIVCNESIKKYDNKINVSLVDPHGKVSITEFQKMSYNGKSSVVLCKPLTGRTHQIRVHLQYLGHPILNDALYNNEVFGPKKGKHGILNKTIDQLFADLQKAILSNFKADDTQCGPNELDKYLISERDSDLNYELGSSHEKNLSAFTYDQHCYFCSNKLEWNQTHFGMFLHALRYQGENWTFETEMPTWASESFTAV